ncbi:hypothetical protein Dimus_031947 [Dionaea muscipula]
MTRATFALRVGSAVQRVATMKQVSWYTNFMEAASRAIAERMSLVDFVIDVRDARIPLSSECELLRCFSSSSRRIVVMNKVDLAKRTLVKEWIRHFERENCVAYGINSHNKDEIQEFLKFLQGQARALRKEDIERNTITMMLVGIPNVGKSALANSLHLVWRISAAEKGRLKHVVVNPLPGETKNICSLKIASHPNIYVLDTPGILPPRITDIGVCSKLALTGAVRDCLVGKIELAQYFLAVLNTCTEYKKWKHDCSDKSGSLFPDEQNRCLHSSELAKTCKRQYPSDHTQDFIVRCVRTSLSEAISSFEGNVKKESDMERLIGAQFAALKEAFRLPMSSQEDDNHKVAFKLLNLYRIGRLGRYTLDPLPRSDIEI